MKNLFLFVALAFVSQTAFPQAARELKTDVVTLKQQGSAPASPASGSFKTYVRDSKLRIKNSSGTESTVGTGGGAGGIPLLTDGSFEDGITEGACTTCTASHEGTVVQLSATNLKSLKMAFAAATGNYLVDKTLGTTEFTGVQGVVSCFIKTSAAGVKLWSRINGADSLSVAVDSSDVWKEYVIPDVMGATSFGYKVEASGSITDDVYVDNCYVGVMPATMTPEGAQAQLAGESYFAGTTNCSAWARTNTALGALATDADCPGPTIVVQNLGTWATTDADLPRQTIANLPAGNYRATFYIGSAMATAGRAAFAINDGTTTCEAQPGNSDITYVGATAISCLFSYSSPGTRVFELYAASTANANTVYNDQTAPRISTRFQLEYFPPSSKVFSQQWLPQEIPFTGSGSWVSNTTYVRATYKYLPEGWVEYTYYLTVSGAPTSASLTLNLPAGHVIDTSRLPKGTATQLLPGIGNAQDASPSYVVVPYFVTGVTTNVLMELVGAAGTFADYNNSVTQAAPMTFASGDALHVYFRVPIVGYTGTTITASFKEMMRMNGIDRPKVCYFQAGGASDPSACTSSPCTEYLDTCGIFSNTRSGTGVYPITAASGAFAATAPAIALCTSVGVPRYSLVDGSTRRSNASGGLVFEAKYYAGATTTATDSDINCVVIGSQP